MTSFFPLAYKNPLLQTLQERGFLYQMTNDQGLDNVLQNGPITAYLGCDVTAPSLHVGNLLGLMVVRWMKTFHHNVLLLLGEGTTKIGDPSGKDEQRKLLDEETIQKNALGIYDCYKRVCGEDIPVVNNKDWLFSLGYIDFLRDIGVHFSVNRMLSFDSIKNRLDRQQSLSFIEFNYILLQSYDFLHLFQEKNCILQLGGSDQWGNIVSGIDLIKKITGKDSFGLTWPLMETASGQKMGKSAAGALWLDPQLCSPYTYWQFWRNVEDQDVYRFLRLYTMLPMEDIKPFEYLEGHDLEKGKILLGDEATALLHGKDTLKNIHKAISYVFLGENKTENLKLCILKELWDTLPHVVVTSEEWRQGKRISELLTELGFVKSRKEGRDRIKEGSTAINHKTIYEELETLPYDIREDENPELSFVINLNISLEDDYPQGFIEKTIRKIFLLTFGGKKQGLIGVLE